MRVCPKCQVTKSLTEFPKRGSRPLSSVWCRPCTNEDNRASYRRNRPARIAATQQYKAEHPDWYKKYQRNHFAERKPEIMSKRRWQILKTKYGITREQYEDLWSSQNGRCAICNSEPDRSPRGSGLILSVDHCHNTGKVRALLCRACNAGLGHFNEDILRLEAAIRYLKAHKEEQAA